MGKPNLFVVGFPKCGTTTLAKRLSNHSSIFLPEIKELQYFDSKYFSSNLNGPGDKKTIINSLEEYLEKYEGRSEPYLMDATPSYVLEDDVAKDIFDFNKNARVIIMVRNPVERAFSNYAHLVRDQREKLPFAEALEAEEERRKNNWSSFWRYKDSSFYYKRIMNYFNIFGQENVKVIISDELKQNQKVIIDDIFDWLGIERQNIYTNVTYNKSGSPTLILKIINKLKKNIIIRKIGKRVISKESFERFKSKNLKTLEVDKSIYNTLKNEFKSDIQKLENKIEKNLSHWYK